MLKCFRQSYLTSASIALFIITLLTLNYLNPMQSDDYGYSLMAFNFEAHLSHYMTWSGRVVADYISPSLLAINNKALLSLIQTTAVAFLIFLMVQHTCINKKNRMFFYSIAAMIFFTSHPSFGQANLWVVGSANYLWPSIFYIFLTSQVINYILNNKFSTFTYPVALFAGCSNENASLAVIGLIIIAISFIYFSTKKIDTKLVALLSITIVGAIVLLAAPGNEHRLMDSAFAEWRNLSTFDKFKAHFTKQIPDTLKASKLLYITTTVLVLYAVVTVKNNKYIQNRKPTLLSISILLFFMSLGCSAIMVFSPGYPDRAKTAAFTFCLMSLIYGLAFFVERDIAIKKITHFQTMLFVVFIFFIPPTISTYKSINNQNKIRLNIIKSENSPVIPDFYFNYLPSKTYRFDTWQNIPAMSKYYSKNISTSGTDMDYSVLSENPLSRLSNPKITDSVQSSDVYLYNERYTLDTVIIVSVPFTNDATSNMCSKVSVHVTDYLGKRHAAKCPKNTTEINGQKYLAFRLKYTPSWFIDTIFVTQNNADNHVEQLYHR